MGTITWATTTTTTTATLTANIIASITDATAHAEEVPEEPEVPDTERSKQLMRMEMWWLQWNVFFTLLWILKCSGFVELRRCRRWRTFSTFAMQWLHDGTLL